MKKKEVYSYVKIKKKSLQMKSLRINELTFQFTVTEIREQLQ